MNSWLNMAEVEFAVLLGQCLDQRIPKTATVRWKAAAWQRRRNQMKAIVNWQFTTTKARTKLQQLCPSSSLWWPQVDAGTSHKGFIRVGLFFQMVS
jgi:hypothetical protein